MSGLLPTRLNAVQHTGPSTTGGIGSGLKQGFLRKITGTQTNQEQTIRLAELAGGVRLTIVSAAGGQGGMPRRHHSRLLHSRRAFMRPLTFDFGSRSNKVIAISSRAAIEAMRAAHRSGQAKPLQSAVNNAITKVPTASLVRNV